jgi:hypothetical protein
MPFISWLLRPILIVAALIAGWFVAEDSANFTVIQMVVAVVLIAVLVALAAFWEMLADWLKERRDR